MVEKLRFFQERSSNWITAKDHLQSEMSTAFLQQLKELQKFLDREEKKDLNELVPDDSLYFSQKQLYSLDCHTVLVNIIA